MKEPDPVKIMEALERTGIDTTCSKCGTRLSLPEYKFCTKCGTPFVHTPFNIDKSQQSQLYKGIGLLHNAFFGKDDRQHFNLMSDGAAQTMYRFANFQAVAMFQEYTGGVVLTKEQGEAFQYLFWNIVIDGYFAWIAETALQGKKIFPSTAPNAERFEKECLSSSGEIYNAVIATIYNYADTPLIKRETASDLFTFVMTQARSYFGSLGTLQPLTDRYFDIQAVFYQTIAVGYGTAVADAKYRV